MYLSEIEHVQKEFRLLQRAQAAERQVAHLRRQVALLRVQLDHASSGEEDDRDPAGHRIPCGRIECQVGDGEWSTAL